MSQTYTHRLGEVTAISGRYELEKEGRVAVKGREVLYVVGNAVLDTSCCGVGGCRYALVPGFLVAFHSEVDPEGVPISRVEPVKGAFEQQLVKEAICAQELVNQVVFW